MHTVRIWDLPTRLFHWFLAACVLGLFATGQIGGQAMVWHFRLGYAVLTLLLFRLVWGLIGGHWSRWSALPLAAEHWRAFWRGPAVEWAGHNPLGSLSVLLMLSLLLLQVGSGLVCDDEIANAGPLTALVSGATVSTATAWHKSPGKTLLIALVLLHLGAIAWYRWRKGQALVPAMWHGDKSLLQTTTESRDGTAQRLLALTVLLACAAFVAVLVRLGGA
jgi:cytochrome b